LILKDSLWILLVDDNDETRKIFSEYLSKDLSPYLRQRTMNILMATDGAEAMHKITRQAFDLIITDNNMPKKDGLTLIRSISHDKDLIKKPPFVFISGEFETDAVAEAINLGVKHILTKPVTRQRFINEVKKALNFI